MRPSFLVSATAVVSQVRAVFLFAADSGGNVTTLSLAEDLSLTVDSRTAECQVNPSWLTLDKANQVLYCLDRGGSNSTSGSLNSFAVGSDGILTHIDRVAGPLSVVAGEILDLDNEAKGRAYMTASYNRSTAAVFALGSNKGELPGTKPVQQLFPTVEEPGPVASRQDRSYLHHVIVDPKGRYVLMPDLGADRIRVYNYNRNNGELDEGKPLVAEPGAGPRHGVFLTKDDGQVFFFFNGELSQKVYSYRASYGEDGLEFEQVGEVPAVDASLPATMAPTSEIALSPDNRFIIVSSREKSFRDSPILGTGPSDTLSTFYIHDNGTLELVQLAPSGGWSPRQFSLNKAGDLLAVGHEMNSTVVIWKRDVESGKIILEEDGGKVAEVTLSGKVVATIWDE